MKMHRLFILACAAILLLAGPAQAPAFAQVACGEALTHDATLARHDPVTTGACPRNGLILGDGVTLDCSGLTIAGKGRGTGIGVASGAEGVTIINCVVDNFETGIDLGGLGSHTVEGAVVLRSKANGLEILTDSNTVTGTVAQKNGKIGFYIKGDGNDVETSVALENGKAGFSIGGKNHYLDSNFSISNGADGFIGTGRAISFSLNSAISNKGDGVNFGSGSVNEPNEFSENKAISNGGNGILVGGSNPDAAVDYGDNKGTANSGPVQCQIAREPCS